ncbi:MAG: hypothetical protein KDD55_12470 [Bdellovibrionales bacterium]|nr:hypothetical protein [Bdellovibrionales bacterium]
MRTAIITNSSVGAASGASTPSSASTSAGTTASIAQASSQSAESSKSETQKTLAAERAISVSPRPEGNFDPQHNNPEKEGAALTAHKEEHEEGRGEVVDTVV